MSDLTNTLNLTLYGCPLHYIKAREALSEMDLEQEIILEINSGDAVDEVIASLRSDGQLCEVISEQTLTSIIKVVKKS
jgi:TusA-related sulfurtransferase